MDEEYVYRNGRPRRRMSFAQAVVMLMLHVLGAGVTFVAIAAVGWFIELAIDAMDKVHRFSPKTGLLLGELEYWLTILDAGIFTVVVLVGAVRFVRDIVETMK